MTPPMEDTSTFLHHEPCPECGSSNNLGRYSDGHGHCFGCGYYEHGDGENKPHTTTRRQMKAGLLPVGEVTAIPARKLKEETCAKWGYTVGEARGEKVQIANYRDDSGTIVFQKIRPRDKDKMFAAGDISLAGLYGQHLWRNGGKKVVITEGEIDALSVSQAQDNKWPVVSLPNGTKGAHKALARSLQWLDKFDEVVLMFDNDEHGIAAAAECAPLFKPGKCKIAKLPLKDANDMLKAGRVGEIIDAIWGAKTWRPDGVVSIADIRARILEKPQDGLPWYVKRLTELTYGRRWGELYGFGAGTGVGKTDFFTEQILYDTNVLGERVGLFILEQNPSQTGKRVAGKMANKRFHVPNGTWTQEELIATIDKMEAENRILLFDNFGATDWDIVETTIRWLHHSEGIRLFYLDHITALTADSEDETKALVQIMAKMSGLAQALGIIIHFVSHLATPEGKSHEEGGRVLSKHFRGSRAIQYWAHYMFGLERNKMHDDRELRKVTTLRVIKDRFTGEADNECLWLKYDHTVGRLNELDHNPHKQNDPQTGSFPDEDQQGAF